MPVDGLSPDRELGQHPPVVVGPSNIFKNKPMLIISLEHIQSIQQSKQSEKQWKCNLLITYAENNKDITPGTEKNKKT